MEENLEKPEFTPDSLMAEYGESDGLVIYPPDQTYREDDYDPTTLEFWGIPAEKARLVIGSLVKMLNARLIVDKYDTDHAERRKFLDRVQNKYGPEAFILLKDNQLTNKATFNVKLIEEIILSRLLRHDDDVGLDPSEKIKEAINSIPMSLTQYRILSKGTPNEHIELAYATLRIKKKINVIRQTVQAFSKILEVFKKPTHE